MQNLSETALAENIPQSSSNLQVKMSIQGVQEVVDAKTTALMQKCDSLLEALSICEFAYVRILSTLADVNQECLERLELQIVALKENIPHLERKWIKRIKVKGTLTDLHKTIQKMNLKPRRARTRDLSKVDDFLLQSYRTLSFINDKAQRARASNR